MMIPTSYKSKLPKSLSYPVGALVISEALADIPQKDSIDLSFYAEPVWPAAEFRRLLREKLPYRILNAEYRPAAKPGVSASNLMVESGWYKEKWRLTIYPVPSEVKHVANKLLCELGLPEVVQWMKSYTLQGWNIRSQQLELIFSSRDEMLSFQLTSGV